MSSHTLRRAALLACSAALAATLGGCTSDSTEEDAGQRSGPPVVAPGKPGEEARTLSPGEAATARPKTRHNRADVAYVQKMIVHHGQALEMTALAEKHAEAGQVRGIAERIDGALRPEIDAMKAWLKNHNEPLEAPSGHHHSDMPGMATDDQLNALSRARGAEFDKLFLELMIAHHEGAVTMAAEVLSEGNDILVEEMANDVIAQQSSEIDRMHGMR